MRGRKKATSPSRVSARLQALAKSNQKLHIARKHKKLTKDDGYVSSFSNSSLELEIVHGALQEITKLECGGEGELELKKSRRMKIASAQHDASTSSPSPSISTSKGNDEFSESDNTSATKAQLKVSGKFSSANAQGSTSPHSIDTSSGTFEGTTLSTSVQDTTVEGANFPSCQSGGLHPHAESGHILKLQATTPDKVCNLPSGTAINHAGPIPNAENSKYVSGEHEPHGYLHNTQAKNSLVGSVAFPHAVLPEFNIAFSRHAHGEIIAGKCTKLPSGEHPSPSKENVASSKTFSSDLVASSGLKHRVKCTRPLYTLAKLHNTSL